MPKETIQVHEIEISAVNADVAFSISAKANFNRLTGIAFTVDAAATLSKLYETLLSTDLTVDTNSVLPEKMGLRSLYSGNEICPNDRFWCLNECITTGTKISGRLVNNTAVLAPYKLKVLLRLEAISTL